MAAPKIDPFGDGEALDLTAEVAEQESAAPETQTAAPAESAPAQEAQQQAEPDASRPEQAVPYPRFKEVVEQRTAAQQERDRIAKERDELREKWARYDERAKQLAEANQFAAQQAKQAQQAAQRPDPTIDPTGAELYDTRQKLAQIEANFNQFQQQYQQTAGNLQQHQVAQEHSNWIQYQAQSYAQQDPHYFEKAQKAANWRIGFWQKLGMTPDEASERVQQESMLITAEARKHGVNFAPFIAELADVLDLMASRQSGGNGNGQAHQNGNGNAQKLQQVAAGQRVQGIGHLPGNTGDNQGSYRTYTPAQIAGMSEGEFSRVMANPKLKADLQYAMALAEGIDPNQMGRI